MVCSKRRENRSIHELGRRNIGEKRFIPDSLLKKKNKSLAKGKSTTEI